MRIPWRKSQERPTRVVTDPETAHYHTADVITREASPPEPEDLKPLQTESVFEPDSANQAPEAIDLRDISQVELDTQVMAFMYSAMEKIDFQMLLDWMMELHPNLSVDQVDYIRQCYDSHTGNLSYGTNSEVAVNQLGVDFNSVTKVIVALTWRRLDVTDAEFKRTGALPDF